MNCPSCGAERIHRSRRRGVVEQHLFPALSVYPFRCHACKLRFLRVRSLRGDAEIVVKAPPPWLRAAFWTAIAIAGGLLVAVIAIVALS